MIQVVGLEIDITGKRFSRLLSISDTREYFVVLIFTIYFANE